jgi:hypothetical protein
MKNQRRHSPAYGRSVKGNRSYYRTTMTPVPGGRWADNKSRRSVLNQKAGTVMNQDAGARMMKDRYTGTGTVLDRYTDTEVMMNRYTGTDTVLNRYTDTEVVIGLSLFSLVVHFFYKFFI